MADLPKGWRNVNLTDLLPDDELAWIRREFEAKRLTIASLKARLALRKDDLLAKGVVSDFSACPIMAKLEGMIE